jgi:DHA3 family macrolide efflux protein-like MFS transporter
MKQLSRAFAIIWTGQAFSLLGSILVQFALVWWLARATGSATILTLATLFALLPQIVLGPFAGALVDRWNRRLVLIFSDGFTALATIVLAVLFWRGVAGVGAIFLLLMLRSAGAAFQWPAMQASTTLMIPREQLARIGGLNQLLAGAAAVFIPPLGALAMEALPMQAILAIDVATALPAIVPLLFLSIPQPEPRQPGGMRASLRADLAAGFRFILGWRALTILIGIGLVIYMLGRAAGSLMPLLLLQGFGGGVRELGWWQAAAGIGTILGGVLLGLWGGTRRRITTQMAALALDGFVIIGLGLLTLDRFAWTIPALFAVGLLESIVLGLGGAIAQAIIPPNMQGRVFGLNASLTQVLAPLGLLAAGPFADAFGIRSWWILSGIIIAGMGIAALAIPSVMHIEDTTVAWRTGHSAEPE